MKSSERAASVSHGGWAAFIGALLGSGVISALIGLVPTYFPAPRSFEWVKSGLPPGDCTASDTAATYDTPKPQAINCAASDLDTIAVCWDGTEYKNGGNPKHDSSAQWCTYKAINADHCKGGVNPGIIWTCRVVQKR